MVRFETMVSAILAFVLGFTALGVAQGRSRRDQLPPSLCQVSPSRRLEQAQALFESRKPRQPSPKMNRFLDEWTEDVEPEERERFDPTEVLGHGNQGYVVAARDLATGRMVAIKQIDRAFGASANHGLRTIRELTYYRVLNNSDYVASIQHTFLPKDKESFSRVYFATELMDMAVDSEDVLPQLHALPSEKQKILMFDVLSALADIHSAGIFHRDMALRNIVANTDCQFKVIDFGVSAPVKPDFTLVKPEYAHGYHSRSGITSRAPELLPRVTGVRWRESFDIWATACALLKALTAARSMCRTTRRVDAEHAVRRIVRVLGRPGPATLAKYDEEARRWFELAPSDGKPVGLVAEYPDSDPALLRVLERMMDLDPDNRPSAVELLQDSAFAGILGPRGNGSSVLRMNPPSLIEPIEMLQAFNSSANHYRQMVYEEIRSNYYHGGGLG